jgi:hypothetical protein
MLASGAMTFDYTSFGPKIIAGHFVINGSNEKHQRTHF